MAGKIAMDKIDDDYSEWRCEDDCRTIENAVALMADKKKWPKIRAKLKKKQDTLAQVDEFMGRVQKDE